MPAGTKPQAGNKNESKELRVRRSLFHENFRAIMLSSVERGL